MVKSLRLGLAALVLLAAAHSAPALADPGPGDDGSANGEAAVDTIYKLYLPILHTPYKLPTNSFFGVVGSSIEAQTVAGYPGDLDSNAPLRNKSMYWLEQTGISYFRTYGSDSRIYSWRFVNPANDVYDWSKWDLLVQSAQAHNVSILASIGNGVPQWANGACADCWREKPLDLWTDPWETSAWYKYVYNFVERYDGDGINDMPGLQRPIKYYEMWNEPDLRQGWVPPAYLPHQFNGNVNDYVRLSQVGYDAVKDADSTATVVGPATAQTAGNSGLTDQWFIWDWPQWMAAGGLNYVDIVSFTRYPDFPTWDADNYVAVILGYADANRGGKPVWLTETGFSGSSNDASQVKARDFARFTFQAWSYSFVKRFFWYSYHEPQFGNTQLDGFPANDSAAKAFVTTTDGDSAIGFEPDPYFHPLYRASEVLLDVFGAFTADDHPVNVAPNDQVRVYRFDKDGQTVWAAWVKANSGTQNINLDTNGRDVRMIGLFGDDLGIYHSGATLTLGSWPIYLTTNLNWNQDIGRITGRVHTSAHVWANGISGLTVQAIGPNNLTVTGLTDADGNYSLTGLPEGSYTVTVLGQGTTPANRVVVVDRETRWGRTSFTIP